MSERHVELMRRFNDAFNTRDVEAFLVYCDPGIEFHAVFATVFGGVYDGHDGMRRFFRDLADAWEEFRVEPEVYFDLGEHVLSFNVLRGRGLQSGAEVAMPIAQVTRWRDGLCVYLQSHADREEAFGELGVLEDELEPIAP